jgi:hypothetical protein
MASELLHDLICTCKGQILCRKNCMCKQQNIGCTDMCPCNGAESCKNPLSRTQIDEDDAYQWII